MSHGPRPLPQEALRAAPGVGAVEGWRRVVLGYGVGASLWIFFSDRILGRLAGSLDAAVGWSMVKGGVFVGVTTGLLYLALRRLARRVKEGEATLRESEERFRALVEAASDAIVVESEARFAYVNPAAMALLGADGPEQLVGGYVVDRFEPTAWEAVLERMRAVHAVGRRVGPLEVNVVRLDGERRRVELSAVPFAMQGKPAAMVLARDVTERRQAADRLAEQLTLTEGILRSTPDAISVKDREGRYRLANPPMEQYLGRRPDELLGQTDAAFLAPEDSERAREEDRRVMECGVPSVREETVRVGGGVRSLMVSRSPLRGPDGAILGLVTVGRDLREQARAEAVQRAVEGRFEAFLGHLPGLALVLDSEGRLLFVNRGLARRFGVAAEEVRGRRPSEVFPEALARFLEAGVERVVRTGRSVEEEVELREPGGASGFHRAVHFPIVRSGEPGSGDGAVGVLTVDVTERREAEQAVHGLTARLLELQDAERRRLAKELHDTTAQDLTAIGLGLMRILQVAGGVSGVREAVGDCMGLVEKSGRDVRTLSYLLHPPLLDELGLPAALREFVQGLVRRSGMRVRLECGEGFGRLGRERETALFRIAQESLAGVRRGLATTGVGAVVPEVLVELRRDGDGVVLSVTDGTPGAGGGGAASERLRSLAEGAGEMGVGLLGMQERIRRFGGQLSVTSESGRTAVRARLPLPPDESIGGSE